ncbi:MAG: DUF1727 domain-containing protein [Clostridiales bacterium]|nr:DUF1727 domain-containing protein [Clostridiales bacterium]
MKTAIIILINKIVYFIGKLVGKGSSYPGKLALKLDKDILKKVKLPENIIMVTGSNGKTSTVGMICKVLEDNGYNVGCNKEGANQTEGVTTMILNCCNLKGEVKKDILVIESDEKYTRHTVKHFKPKYLVVTNLYRDQMTRSGHPELVYDVVKDAISDGIHLILNTDDPLSSMYGLNRENVTYFGMNENELVKKENTSAYDDDKYCPNCKEVMNYEYYHFNHIGKYKCQNCGHERKNPNYAITSLDLKNGIMKINEEYEVSIALRSIYNAYNLLAAFAVCDLVGVTERNIIKSLNNYIINNGRIENFKVNNTDGMVLVSKHENSISYNQSLLYIKNENKKCTVVVIVDAISRRYYTAATYWLWDIDFELLNTECVDNIVLSGKYAYDLAMRFEHTNIEKEKIIIEPDINLMIDKLKDMNNNYIYTVTCFKDKSTFLKLLKDKEGK